MASQTISNAIAQPVYASGDFSSTIPDDDEYSPPDDANSPLFLDASKRSEGHSDIINEIFDRLLDYIKYSSDFILELIAPLFWCAIFIIVMDRQTFIRKFKISCHFHCFDNI